MTRARLARRERTLLAGGLALVTVHGLDKRLLTTLQLAATRAVSGMRTSESLNPLIGRIAPRPVLLVASGGFPEEIPANRVYRERGGPTVSLWELPEAAHTGGLRARPAEYERRVTAFLDHALGV